MRNLEPLIAEINFILDSVELPPQNQLDRIARWYSDEVVFFNDELRQTRKLIDVGGKQKAFQRLSQGESNLQESSRLLDFDRRTEWIDFCGENQITLPAEIDKQTFQDLESALDDFAPVESLLQRLRILVLGEAPAFSRHAILKLLCRRDSKNENWKKDLLEIERYRIENLPREIANAREQFDRQQLLELAAEVEAIAWESKVPDEIMAFVRESTQEDFCTGPMFELNKLSSKMIALFEARKWEEANLVKKEWDALYQKTDDAVKASMTNELDDVFDWTTQASDTNKKRPNAAADDASFDSENALRAKELIAWGWVFGGIVLGFVLLAILYWSIS